MKPNIRERGQKVADYIKTNVNQTLAAIAAATGVSKSSVHRHQQSIEQRQQYPESDWWETKVGYVYLVRLVVGVIYFFGIKQGVGAESLSEFYPGRTLRNPRRQFTQRPARFQRTGQSSHY